MRRTLYTTLFLFFIVPFCSAQLVYTLDDDAAYVAKKEKEAAAPGLAVLPQQPQAGSAKRIELSATVERYQSATTVKLAAALLQGEEWERKRLAGDLHDGLGGMLAGVKINLSRLSPATDGEAVPKDLPVIINQLDRSVNELRRIARNMMPESLLNSGLEIALKEICESFAAPALQVDFQAYNIEKNISQDMQVTIFRIVQELLTNAVRHAGATTILVQCSQNENTFYITIEDNGKGFKTDQAAAGKGIGLTNVKNRVDYLKGNLDIESSPGAGTTINIEFHVG